MHTTAPVDALIEIAAAIGACTGAPVQMCQTQLAEAQTLYVQF